MAKGQITTIIIILVVIGAVVYFALPTLQNLPLGGGGGGGGTLQINNNIITVESYSVSSLKMFPQEQTTVSFLVQNNGDHSVNNVEVIFFDLGGMQAPSITASDNTKIRDETKILSCNSESESKVNNQKCLFKELKPFESKKIILTLEAPEVGSLTTFKISYSITYSYKGIRSAIIPVIDGVTRTTPLGKFSQSQSAYNPDETKYPSYGPIELSYSFPTSGTTKVNNQIITQNWGVDNQPFRLELDLKHVGTVDGAQPVRLKSITLTYPTKDKYPNNYLDAPDISNNFCPIGNTVNDRINQESDSNFVGPPSISAISSSRALTLNCQFTPHIGSSPESNVEVSTIFEYQYTILRSETFTVQPLEQKR